MCTDIYLGSKKELEPVIWNEKNPGFYTTIVKNKETINFLDNILHLKFYYELGSHMGCSCGLSYGDWSRNDIDENHESRVNDVNSLFEYLRKMPNNVLKIFCTTWEDNVDNISTTKLDLNKRNLSEFDFEKNIIYLCSTD